MIRWSLGEALRGWAFEPVEAETASAALAAFDAEPPAAILLDINLPDASGLDVLRKIRQRQPDAVVIMIRQTGWRMKQSRPCAAARMISSASRSILKNSTSRFATASKLAACAEK